ncbi:MAG: DNA recombination protein RmuC [Chlamydiales bacterium]|nr:DNA recombination protein RmuC [Chlamydiales bacterium]
MSALYFNELQLVIIFLILCLLTFLWYYRKLKTSYHLTEEKYRELEAENKLQLIEKQQLSMKLDDLSQLGELLEAKKEEVASLREALALSKKDLESHEALFQQEREAAKEKLQFLEQAKQQLNESFKALTHEIMQKQQQSFLLSAKESFSQLKESSSKDLQERQKAIKEFVGDLRGSLKEVNEKVETLEKGRVRAYTSLEEHLTHLHEAQNTLHKETQQLVSTLKAPTIRGQWGEMQLKRVLELSGMLNYCDFIEQHSLKNEESARLRPDILVQLPNHRSIVIDAKVPLQSFIDSLEEGTDSPKEVCLEKHSKALKRHMQQLASKNYWQQFESSPEFVIMFLPGEVIYTMALQHDPNLIEFGVEKNVIIATPSTLIALLRSVAYGWNQTKLAENAKEIALLGKELYTRLANFSSHFLELKKGLEKAVGSYNQALGSFENRVLTTAKKFESLGASPDKEIKALEPIEKPMRELTDNSSRL